MHVAPRLLVAGLSAVALVATGCGHSTTNVAAHGSAQQQLAAAVRELGAGSVITVTAQLTGTGSAASVDRHEALLAGSVFTAEARDPSGAALATVKGIPDVDVALTNAGRTLGELRVVSGALYARLDVAALTNGKNLSASKLLRELPRNSAWVQAALAGRWVTLPAAALSAVTQQFGGASVLGGSSLTRLESALQKATTVTDTGNGLFVVTLDTKAARMALGSVGPMAGAASPRSESVRTVRLDAYVTGGVLSRVTFDLSQLPADKGHRPRGVFAVAFTQSGPAIAAPTGATTVNLTDLAPLFGRFMSVTH